MESRRFSNLSENECRTISNDILNHSDHLWKQAKVLSKNKAYGTAISIAIVSIEELIKGLVLLFDSHGFEFRKVKGINTFFKNHHLRYVIAYYLFVITLFGEEVAKFIIAIRTDPSLVPELLKLKTGEKEVYDRKLKHYAISKLVLLKRELDWFDNIDKFRQEGLYSDYVGEFKSPLNTSESDFSYIIEKLGKIRDLTKVILEVMESEDNPDKIEIEKIKLDLKEKDYYTKIGEAITLAKKSNKSPLELLRSNFLGR